MKNALLLFGNIKAIHNDPLYHFENSYMNFFLHIKRYIVDVNDCDVYMITSYMSEYEVKLSKFIFNKENSNTVKNNIKKIFGDKLKYICITNEDEQYKKEEEELCKQTKKKMILLFNRLKQENPKLKDFQQDWNENTINNLYMFPRTFFSSFKIYKLFQCIENKNYDNILTFRPDFSLQQKLDFKMFDSKLLNNWSTTNCFLTNKVNMQIISKYVLNIAEYHPIYKINPISALHSETNISSFINTLKLQKGTVLFSTYILYHGTRRFHSNLLLKMDKNILDIFNQEITNENLHLFL